MNLVYLLPLSNLAVALYSYYKYRTHPLMLLAIAPLSFPSGIIGGYLAGYLAYHIPYDGYNNNTVAKNLGVYGKVGFSVGSLLLGGISSYLLTYILLAKYFRS